MFTKALLTASCVLTLGLVTWLPAASGQAEDSPAPVFNRTPLADKPYAELPLGAIRPEGWLRDELQRMAAGMTGHLDEWYPEVCGDRNAWLGGDGDTWERGPYWIDGLYPLAKLLDDRQLEAKAQRWIEWTLANQRPDGQIGPREIENRTQPPPRGAQTIQPGDWWPRMVMLKILQQHYMATADRRVIDCLTRYFQYQLEELPQRPLHDPDIPGSGSWWAAQRGGDNLMVVLWLYNVTGDAFLLELADLIHEQTVPVTDWFSPGSDNMLRRRMDQGDALHCVNLAQMMKTPVVRWQQDQDPRHLDAVKNAFIDIRTFHGQPHGLYGGDEGMHGHAPDRGSELCSAVEMMYSLEKMFEVTGDTAFGDQLERIAFNALPTQTTDDYRGRQYFQQTNQVQCTFGDRDFFNDNGDRVVYGLLQGYPCCTCNLHQGWPKFTQHLWMASSDGGIAAVAYAPSSVTTKLAEGQVVSLRQAGQYPFNETVTIAVETEEPVEFPLHVRIPGWADGAAIEVNGQAVGSPQAGSMHVLKRLWNDGDLIRLRFPMPIRTSTWYNRSQAIERGPLVFALDIAEQWSEVFEPRPDGVPETAMHRGYLEARPQTPWNYGLPEPVIAQPQTHVRIEYADSDADNPWTRSTAPVRLVTKGIRLPYWQLSRNSAAPTPLSPAEFPAGASVEQIDLIPYGASTLRIAAFPWVRIPSDLQSTMLYAPEELNFAAVRASHTFAGDTVEAVRLPHKPRSSADRSIPRWTSWPQRGQEQWVEIELHQPQPIRHVGVYWYDDNQGVHLPAAWHLEYQHDGQWKRLETEGEEPYDIQADRYNVVRAAGEVQTQKLRIVMQPKNENLCVGILSVDVGSPE